MISEAAKKWIIFCLSSHTEFDKTKEEIKYEISFSLGTKIIDVPFKHNEKNKVFAVQKRNWLENDSQSQHSHSHYVESWTCVEVSRPYSLWSLHTQRSRVSRHASLALLDESATVATLSMQFMPDWLPQFGFLLHTFPSGACPMASGLSAHSSELMKPMTLRLYHTMCHIELDRAVSLLFLVLKIPKQFPTAPHVFELSSSSLTKFRI